MRKAIEIVGWLGDDPHGAGRHSLRGCEHADERYRHRQLMASRAGATMVFLPNQWRSRLADAEVIATAQIRINEV